MTPQDLSPEAYAKRLERIEQLRTELGTTRAHAASIVDSEIARENKQEDTK